MAARRPTVTGWLAALFEAGGNPYGTSWPSGGTPGPVADAVLRAARHQGHRLARFAAVLTPAVEAA
jgi:NAD(P)H dehydrogenase (quinone)